MITYIFTPANIRLSFENAKRFLEYFFLKGAHGSHRSRGFFFVASNGDSHLVSIEKTQKELKIREIRGIRVGKFNTPHSALKDSITNLSKHAL